MALLFLLPLMPGSWWNRMSTIRDYRTDLSAMDRINAWGFAINLVRDRPLLGGGFRTFTADLFEVYAPEPEHFVDAHSIYFEVLGEQGLPGLIFYVVLGILSWRACSFVIRSKSEDEQEGWLAELARMAQVSLAAYASAGAFLGLAYFDLYYNILAIIILMKVFAVDSMESPSIDEASQ
jgi:probable O-glycosylation ligase (exosortase A-associated)